MTLKHYQPSLTNYIKREKVHKLSAKWVSKLCKHKSYQWIIYTVMHPLICFLIHQTRTKNRTDWWNKVFNIPHRTIHSQFRAVWKCMLCTNITWYTLTSAQFLWMNDTKEPKFTSTAKNFNTIKNFKSKQGHLKTRF